MSGYTRQCIPFYKVQCRAEIDTLFYSVLCGASLSSVIYWLLLNSEIIYFMENKLEPDCQILARKIWAAKNELR